MNIRKSAAIGSAVVFMSTLPVLGKGIATLMAMTQAGSPLRIESTTSTQEFLFEQIKVKNISSEHIQAITFGVMIYELGNSHAKPVLSKPVAINTNLKPGEERILEAYTISPENALSIGHFKTLNLVAELGILSVEFSGGGTWSFDPVSRGGFQPNAANSVGFSTSSSSACALPRRVRGPGRFSRSVVS